MRAAGLIMLAPLLFTACGATPATSGPGAAQTLAKPTRALGRRVSPAASARSTPQTPTGSQTLGAAADTEPPPPSPGTIPQLESISMHGPMSGWGLTQDGVFRTSDGGRSWIAATPIQGWQEKSIVKGFFLGLDMAWLVQPRAGNFDQGVLFRTRNGGGAWDSIPVPFGPNEMQFLDAQDGLVMADRGAAAGSQAVDIYNTTDGGTSRRKVGSAGPYNGGAAGALPFGGDKLGMAFKDMREGWIGGSQPIVGHSYLYRTRDGGNTWASQDLAIPASQSSGGVLVFAPRFFPSDEGVLPVLLQTQTQNLEFYATHDGGWIWQSSTVVEGGPVYDVTSAGLIWVGLARS